jgi:hypothetical protein
MVPAPQFTVTFSVETALSRSCCKVNMSAFSIVFGKGSVKCVKSFLGFGGSHGNAHIRHVKWVLVLP